jgi:hypothetical protein
MKYKLEERFDIPFKDLKKGWTYIVKEEFTSYGLIEICIEEKHKNSVLIRYNPKTGNVLRWKKIDDKVYEIIDKWETPFLKTVIEKPSFSKPSIPDNYIDPRFLK